MLAAAAALCGFFIIVLRNSGAARRFALGGTAGLLSLGAVNLSSALTGIGLGVNVWTLLGAVLLGLPGVTGMMFLRLIWQM